LKRRQINLGPCCNDRLNLPNKQFNVYINENVVDEFNGNRENVIADSMKYLDKIHQSSPIPNLVKPYPEAAKLREAMAVVSTTAKLLENVVRDHIAEHALKAERLLRNYLGNSK
jgi:hypothetical protein